MAKWSTFVCLEDDWEADTRSQRTDVPFTFGMHRSPLVCHGHLQFGEG